MLTDEQKEKVKKDLIQVGAIPRDKKLTLRDDYYSKSLGERNKPVMQIRI